MHNTKTMRRVIFSGALFWYLTGSAFAYIDPGTGGYVVQSLGPVIGGFFAVIFTFFLGFFRRRLGNFFRGFRKNWRRILLVIGVLAVVFIGFGGVKKWFQERATFDPSLSGAHMYDAAAVDDGYNLFEGRLVDMRGNVVKQWQSLSLGVIDSNGDYYAQKYFEAAVWGRYSWDDKVIWEKNFPIHHEIVLTPQNTIIVFTKEVQEYKGRSVEFDVIVELDKEGQELRRFSLWEHRKEFQKFHRPLELDQPPTFLIPEDHRKDKSIWGGNYDYYHLNALSLIPENSIQGTHPAFTPGNWLVSFRHGSMVFILDKDTQKVLWRAIYDQVADNIEGPHSPGMLANGNILLFDNGRYRKWSRLLEINPVTLKVTWEYRAPDLYTLSQGNVQLLANGNMLVTESEKGRSFELTRQDKRIVWEYYYPDKQDAADSADNKKKGSRREIYRMIRYPKAFIDQRLNN